MKKKKWYDYLWIATAVYLMLGLFNILFAWLGLICFALPLIISISKGSKAYCNKYCGRSKLFQLIGGRFKLSRNKKPPMFLSSKWFRYGFLTFFMTMFGLMLYSTWQVFAGADLREAITLLWTFKIPFSGGYTEFAPAGVTQFAFGFYSIMATSTLLGMLTMFLFKPRSWCVYCPMGTMTQGICYLKHGKDKQNEGRCETNCRAFKGAGE